MWPSRSAKIHTSDGCGQRRTASIAAAALGLAITSSQAPIDRPPPDWPPIQFTERYFPGPFVGRRRVERALLVFVDVEDRRRRAAAFDDFLPMLEVEPLVAAAILPAGRAAGPAIFDEVVARVGVHVGDAPGQPRRAADGHDRRAGERRPHRVFALRPS